MSPGAVPEQISIYHILHIDRLASVIADNALYSDSIISERNSTGTIIGMSRIKDRRMQLSLDSHPGLHVGECVPFYFCPRSIMLYLLFKDNHPDVQYHGGQEPILHLEADLHEVVDWANNNGKRLAFTLSNAGARYFEDRANLHQLDEIDWDAIRTNEWRNCKEAKQAEFLLEDRLPWHLINRIGVCSQLLKQRVLGAIQESGHQPSVTIQSDWYY